MREARICMMVRVDEARHHRAPIEIDDFRVGRLEVLDGPLLAERQNFASADRERLNRGSAWERNDLAPGEDDVGPRICRKRRPDTGGRGEGAGGRSGKYNEVPPRRIERTRPEGLGAPGFEAIVTKQEGAKTAAAHMRRPFLRSVSSTKRDPRMVPNGGL